MTHHLGLVLLECHYDGFVGNLVSFELRKALLDSLFASLVCCFHCNFLRSWVRLKGLDHFILLLLELVLEPFLLHLRKLLFMLFVIIVVEAIAKALAELHTLNSHFLLFLSAELVPLAQIADI